MIKYFIYLLEVATAIGEFTTKEVDGKTKDKFLKPLGKAKKDYVQDCIRNVHEIFYSESDPYTNFSMAMTALSEPLLTLTFIAMNVEDLYRHFASNNDVIGDIGDGIFRSKHQELLEYFNKVSVWKRAHANTRTNSTLAEKQAVLVGYFRSFANKIDDLAERINGIMWSPKVFCSNHKDPDECREALCIMLKLNDVMEMTGSEALKFCYLNYTYLDFTKEKFFLEMVSSSNSVHSSNQLPVDYGFKLYYIRIMSDYFSYLLDVTTQIGEFNRIIHDYPDDHHEYGYIYQSYQNPPIFLAISEYCRTLVQNRRRRKTFN